MKYTKNHLASTDYHRDFLCSYNPEEEEEDYEEEEEDVEEEDYDEEEEEDFEEEEYDDGEEIMLSLTVHY